MLILGFTVDRPLETSVEYRDRPAWERTDRGLTPAGARPIVRTVRPSATVVETEVTATSDRPSVTARYGMFGFPGVGFPHIETGRTQPRYKPYTRMVRLEVGAGRTEVAPDVGCMGLSTWELAERVASWDAKIIELSMRHGVSASLVKAVITEESCFDPGATSPAGAHGLMQLMPLTAAWLGVADPSDPLQNLDGGIRYLARLHQRFDDEALALAAYNAGPGSVLRYGGVPPYPETQRYVERVRANRRRYVAATRLANRLGAASLRSDPIAMTTATAVASAAP